MTIDSKLAIQLKSLLLENTKPSYENYKPQKRYGFQLIFVLKDFDDDEHLIILLADGTRLLLESKTYCFTYGFWEGLALDAKVGPVDVKIFHNNKTYEYWIEDEY